MVVSLEVDSSSIEEIIEGKLRFCSNIVGFGNIKAGFLNFMLIFGLFINSTFSLFLEVIAKLNAKTKLENVYCTCIEFETLGSSIFLIHCFGC